MESKTTTLKCFSTDALIEELASRENVERAQVGAYQEYVLVEKYTSINRAVDAKCILIIR